MRLNARARDAIFNHAGEVVLLVRIDERIVQADIGETAYLDKRFYFETFEQNF
jgi:hypothetical protein